MTIDGGINSKNAHSQSAECGFKYVSSPNYFGEILEWFGWAVATWCLPGAAFALWTMANLSPRAFANHNWYLKTFPDYPKKRKTLVPFIL